MASVPFDRQFAADLGSLVLPRKGIIAAKGSFRESSTHRREGNPAIAVDQ